MKITFKILFIFISIFLVACENLFDYSPYVINFDDDNKNVNQTNINKLSQKSANDIVRIAFTGDSHRFFDELDGFVNAVNIENKKNPFDFVIHVGDIADFGLPQQYLWGNSYLLNLDCPYFVVLGNHDMVGNGSLAYTEMFGKYDFSFIYANIKFVFINTNSLEFGMNGKVPNINWLKSQLQPNDNFDKAVVIFHLPPSDNAFDSTLVEDFKSSIEEHDNVLFTIHGHYHHHEIYYNNEDSLPYINVYGVEYKKYNVIEISNDNFEIETYDF